MVLLKYRDVPLFLQSSSFYAPLTGDNEDFEVPDDCYVTTDSLNNPEDLSHLLRVLRFWDVHALPMSLIEYCNKHPVSDWQEVFMEFEPDLQYLSPLRNICQAPEDSRFLLAVTSGNLNFVEYYNERRAIHLTEKLKAVYKDDENPYFAAVKSGNLSTLKYLYDYCHPEGSTDAENDNRTTKDRSLYTLDWIRNTHNCTRVAAEHGQLPCLQFLYELNKRLTGQEYIFAALNGHLPCIKFLHDCKCCWLPGVAQKATELGYWDCLQFAVENDCPVDNRLMRTAASTGRLDYLDYLYRNGGKLTEDCMSAAASSGHLSIMQYLHTNEVPWNTYIPQTAAYKGHLDCLRYAMEHGCPAEDTIANRAVGANQLPCVIYLLSTGYRASDAAISYAQTQNWTELYEYLVNHNH